MLLGGGVTMALLQPKAAYAATCQPPKDGFFGFPTWYKYLDGQIEHNDATDSDTCQPLLGSLNSVWAIVAAVIEILLRIAMLVAIGFVVFGGVSYVLSQGQPDKTKQALQTIINAIVGLVIGIVATALVNFIAGGFIQK